MPPEINLRALEQYLIHPYGQQLTFQENTIVNQSIDTHWEDSLFPEDIWIQWGSRLVCVQVANGQGERIRQLAQEALQWYTQQEMEWHLNMMQQQPPESPQALQALRDFLVYTYGIEKIRQANPEEVKKWIDENPIDVHRVKQLTLIGKELEGIPSKVGLFLNLTHLNCWNNRITTVSSEMFQSLSSLTVLDLSNNCLNHIPLNAFNLLVNLRKLDLSENALNYLPLDLFNNMFGLQELNLSMNPSLQLPICLFAPLARLQKLDLSENPAIKFSWEMVFGLSILEELTISSDQILNCYPYAFCPLTMLRTLVILDVSTERNLIHIPNNLGLNQVRIETRRLSEF